MEAHWYLKVADKEVGPLSPRQLKAMAERGQISPFDPIRRGSDGRWVPASSIKGLLPPVQSPAGKSQPGHIPVARKLEEPPGAPLAKPASETQAGAAPGVEPSGALAAEIGIAQAAPTTPETPGPVAASPGGFHINTGTDAPAAKAAGRGIADATAPRRHRKRETLVVAIALLVVALAAVGALVMLSGRGRATASTGPEAAAEKAAAEGAGKREEVVIPGLDEYLGEAGPKSPQHADSETPADSQWTDASKSPVECGDVTVKITSAEVGRPRLIRKSSGRAARPRSDYLALGLELFNRSKTKKLDYLSWNVQDAGVTLVDNHGNQYAIKKSFAGQGLEIDGQVEGSKGSLYPEEVTKDVLLFEKPAKSARFLRLALPASAFGEEGCLKFEIPASMIAAAAEPGQDEDEEDAEPGGPPDLAGRAVGPEAEGGHGGGAPALSGGTAESGAQQAPMKGDDREAAQGQPARQEDDGGPIPIPGVTGDGADEKGDDFSFSDDPKLREAREKLRDQEAGGSRKEGGKQDRQ